LVRLLKRLLILYLLEVLILGISSIVGYLAYSLGLLPIDIVNRFKDLAKEASLNPYFIFENNALIATLMSIPAIGVLFFGYALISTGITLGSFLASQLGPSISWLIYLLLSLAITVVLPHGILELGAYALALTNSLDSSREFLKCVRGGGSWGRLLGRFLVYYAVTVALLLVAAYVEYEELQYVRGLVNY